MLIAPSFADIFYNNCFKNGMLPIRLERSSGRRPVPPRRGTAGYRLSVDLAGQTITDAAGLKLSFDVDPFRKHCLLTGWTTSA